MDHDKLEMSFQDVLSRPHYSERLNYTPSAIPGEIAPRTA